MTDEVGLSAVDHTGFAVSSLDNAVRFWTEAMGFAFVREGEMGGAFLRSVTGVDDPHCRMALVRAPDGFTVELLEYSTGADLGSGAA